MTKVVITHREDDLLSPKEAAAYLGIQLRNRPYALRTFYNMCSNDEMVAPDEIRRRRPRWRRSTLDSWVDGQVTKPRTGARRQSDKQKTQ